MNMSDILNLFTLIYEKTNLIKFFGIGLFDLIIFSFIFTILSIFVFSFIKKG